jgi:hypothetical protein
MVAKGMMEVGKEVEVVVVLPEKPFFLPTICPIISFSLPRSLQYNHIFLTWLIGADSILCNEQKMRE